MLTEEPSVRYSSISAAATTVDMAPSWTLVKTEEPKVILAFRFRTASMACLFIDMHDITAARSTFSSSIHDMVLFLDFFSYTILMAVADLEV